MMLDVRRRVHDRAPTSSFKSDIHAARLMDQNPIDIHAARLIDQNPIR